MKNGCFSDDVFSWTFQCLTSTAVKKGGLYSLDISSVYQYKNTLIGFKVDAESNVSSLQFSAHPFSCTGMLLITMLLYDSCRSLLLLMYLKSCHPQSLRFLLSCLIAMLERWSLFSYTFSWYCTNCWSLLMAVFFINCVDLYCLYNIGSPAIQEACGFC